MSHRRGVKGAVLAFAFAAAGYASLACAGPIAADTWYEFGFTDVGVAATGCDPADPAGAFCVPSGGTPTTFLDAPPWTFVAPAGGSLLQVTDAFLSGDRFEIFDLGVSIGFTSPPAAVALVDCGDDPVVCLATGGMSSGTFALAAGAHSITLVPTESPNGGGAGYFRVSAAVTVAEPASLALIVAGLAGVPWARRRRRH